MTTLIKAENLCTWFPVTSGFFKKVTGYTKAVDGVNFHIDEGEIVSVVGESGCGKSTLGNSLLGLVKPTSGSITLDGIKLDTSLMASWKSHRKNFQMIFQDPYSSLNPRQTVFEIISEPLLVHSVCSKSEVKSRVAWLLDKVGLNADYMDRYPHAFSGGQRQRIGIARVLGINPKVIICDEIVSALDVSVQAQVIRLLLDLKNEFNLSLLFIAHDLSLVKVISDRIYVMYLGKVVEEGEAKRVFAKPCHPYTQSLLESIPTLDRNKRPVILEGEVSSSDLEKSGCVFYPRCKNKRPECTEKEPELSYIQERKVACFFPNS